MKNLEIVSGSQLYVDVDELLREIQVIQEQNDTTINAPKYEILRLMIDVLLTQHEEVDTEMGIYGLNKASIPFKIAYNTLINYNILKEN
tara:strand:+ start:663 stop:929 length:267 start_codon:yes stop_codon:yes gene_type:complete